MVAFCSKGLTNQSLLLLFSVSSLEIVIFDPQNNKNTFLLNKPNIGLYVPKNHTPYIRNISSSTVTLHLLNTNFFGLLKKIIQ
jgi:hypothetical protein